MPVPVDLSKLSDVVKNDVVKKTVYDQLVVKVNNIDTSDFVLKTNYQTDKIELEKKIPDTSGLVKYRMLVISLRKQTVTQKLLKLKINLLTIIMINILLLRV